MYTYMYIHVDVHNIHVAVSFLCDLPLPVFGACILIACKCNGRRVFCHLKF